jgi:hypothetical protein
LLPLLSSQAKAVIGRMRLDDLNKYDEVKKFLLAEFKLTICKLCARFSSASKLAD